MRSISRILFIASVLSPMVFAQANKQCTADFYKIVPLPFRPLHINDSSQVVGTTETHGAAFWTQGQGLITPPTPAGFATAELVSINNPGEAVGYASDSTATRRQGFRYAGGKISLLLGVQSKPSAINNAGQIVGEAFLSGKKEASPVLWKNQSPIDLGACCGGTALAINNHETVIGNMYDRQGRYHASIWRRPNGIQQLGPAEDFSSAIAINDAGHILVDAFSKGTLMYEDGKPIRLQLSPRYTSKPASLNNCDAMVGAFGPYSDAQRAFLWDRKRGFRDLNDLIPPNSGWKLEQASGINDHGEIIGWGDHNGADDAGFLLIPQN